MLTPRLNQVGLAERASNSAASFLHGAGSIKAKFHVSTVNLYYEIVFQGAVFDQKLPNSRDWT